MAREEVEGTKPDREYVYIDDATWVAHLKTLKYRNMLLPIMTGAFIYVSLMFLTILWVLSNLKETC